MTPLDEMNTEQESMTVLQKHRFFLLIAIVIAISCAMIAIGMYIYNTSGAAQVDLSRPGYKSVRSEAKRDSADDSFPATGPLDDQAFDSFNKMYSNHARQVVGVDSFDPSALDAAAQQLTVDTTANSAEQN